MAGLLLFPHVDYRSSVQRCVYKGATYTVPALLDFSIGGVRLRRRFHCPLVEVVGGGGRWVGRWGLEKAATSGQCPFVQSRADGIQ